MKFTKNLSLQLACNGSVSIAIISTSAAFLASIQSAAVYAQDRAKPAIPVSQAPYSQVFFTGTKYAVKDRDYQAGAPSVGVFSLWTKDPTNNSLQVGVRYCLPSDSLSKAGAYLTGITLLDNNQSLLTVSREIQKRPAEASVVTEPGNYGLIAAAYETRNPIFLEVDGPLSAPANGFDYEPSFFANRVNCSAGASRFDISDLADRIAKLPDYTLQVQLQFSNGTTQTRQLGQKTVHALKDLLTLGGTTAR
ncbi:MAG: hypothetical protein ACAF41_18895 [Leptolyngbya sp. BL-A-14]